MNFDMDRPEMLMARIQHTQAVNGYKQMKKYNIHPKQIPILLTLKDNEGISQRELAQKLNVKPPTIAVSVKRLSTSGFVVKKDDEKDARIYHLYLTDKAKEMMEDTKHTFDDAADKMFDGFTEADKKQFVDYLKKILDNLGPLGKGDCQMDCDDEEFDMFEDEKDLDSNCGEEDV